MKQICKSLRIKVRQQKTKRRCPAKPVSYRVNPNDPRELILTEDGTILRQAIDGVGLFVSTSGRTYALTSWGLRPRQVNLWKKNNYGKLTRNGNRQGQVYPYIYYRKGTYRIHELMALAWLHAKSDDEAIDHINGDIENCDLTNLRVISKEENCRCGGLLKRLRNASIRLYEPRLNPVNIPQEKLLEIFATFRLPKSRKAIDAYLLSLLD